MFASAMIVAGPLFTTLTSALRVSVADVDDMLFAEFGSPVDADTFAVFVTGLVVADDATCATSVNVAVALSGNVAMVQVVPAQLNAGPLFCVIETSVRSGGSVSVSETLVASDGPLFVTVIVYETFAPAVAVPGPLFDTPRSALGVTVVVALSLLFDGFVSNTLEETSAVLVIDVVFPASRTSVNCADVAAGRTMPHEIVPTVLPGSGVEHEAGGPLSCVNETNDVPGGRSSSSVTVAVSEPWPFATMIV